MGQDVVVDEDVSLDGTWQKKGHSSKNRVVTVISGPPTATTGKCLDYHFMSNKIMYKGCQTCSKRQDDPNYNEWKNNHNCHINHTKSSGAMEAAGAVTIFKRSLDKHKLRYVLYIGDGDTSSFNKVNNSKPYGYFEIIKKECVGHVQKCLGTRLRTLRTTLKGKILSDRKKISGRGKLTDKVINTMQNYYGMAIHQYTNDLFAMRKSVIATLMHNTNFDDAETRHQYCPKSIDSWCKYQKDILTGEKTYKDHVKLPQRKKKEKSCNKERSRTNFQRFKLEALLSKCLDDGLTQNNNKLLNAFIWKKCPKNVYVSRNIIEIGVALAVLEFNNGTQGIKKVSENAGLHFGKFITATCKKKDKSIMTYKSVF